MKARSNIIRHFAYKSYIMSFSTSPVQDVYDVQLPRIQITKARAMTAMQESGTIRDAWQSDEREELRLQITAWWKGVKERVNQLEELLDEGKSCHPLKKPLPPSPPLSRNPTDPEVTPKAPPKTLASTEDDKASNPSQRSVTPSISSVSTDGTTTSSLALLSNLRKAFNTTEQSLYATLSRTASSRLNDARRLFYSTSKAASNRLAAWEKKHTPVVQKAAPYPEPDWWSKGYHALPGGSVIVHEGEWASLISFTLSSSDYTAELHEMSRPRPASSVGAEAGSTAPTNSIISSKSDATAETAVSQATAVEFNPVHGLTSFVANMQALAASKLASSALDPDEESTASDWHVSEILRSQISRRDHPRDSSNIMSLRDVLRNKAVDGASLASRFSNMANSNGTSASKLPGKTPPSTVSSTSLELDVNPTQGSAASLTPETKDVFEQILRDAEGDDYTLVDSIEPSSAANTVKHGVRPGGTPPSIDVDRHQDVTPKPSSFIPPPAVPPKDFPTPSVSPATTPATEKTQSQLMSSSTPGSSHSTEVNLFAPSAMESLTSTIANAMRFVLHVGQQESAEQPNPTTHQGILAMESPDIDSRPHIRYECIIGKRLKLSCTAYYAKQFDSLRKRCGVDEVLIQSLKKTENWSAEGMELDLAQNNIDRNTGGKSKSNFWKTTDDRFIIKTLVDAWNVADLCVAPLSIE